MSAVSNYSNYSFIIDPDGVIQGYEVLTPPVGRNVGETFRQVQAFQLVRESKGAEATPSGRRPGKMTLKSGPELVEKVREVWKYNWHWIYLDTYHHNSIYLSTY